MKGLSVQALEQAIKAMRKMQEESAQPLKPLPEKTAHVSSMENELRQKLACRVEIKVQAKEKGQIVIAFDTNDEFERLIEALRR
jgi:ParB family chromosome partitioning protein